MRKLFSQRIRQIIGTYHFWIIVCCIFGLSIFYYSWPWINSYGWLRTFAIIEFSNDIIGSMFLAPMFYAAVLYKWRGALFSWLLCMLMMAPQLAYYSPNIKSLSANMAFLLLPLLLVLFITAQMTWREIDRRNMRARERERQAYVAQVVKAQEDERMRIAHELHDDTTQALLVVANRAQVLLSTDGTKADAEARSIAEWIRNATLQVCEDVRRLSLSLRPSVLDNMGLIPALRSLARQLQNEKHIDIKVLVGGTERTLPAEVEINIFRIVQEALANVKRHSGACTATVRLQFYPDTLKIEIKDDGRGFDIDEIKNGASGNGKLGLASIGQRAQLINGKFHIDSKVGKGTRISVDAKC